MRRKIHLVQMEMKPPGRSASEVVRLFVEHLGRHIDRIPDQHNRETPDIDAIAGDLAIEHTSVDSYEHQRRDGVRFRDVLGRLEEEIGPTLPFRLRILVPHDAVSPGSDWSAIANALRRWILDESVSLPDGRHRIRRVPGIGFEFVAWRDPDSAPGLFFWRPPPSDRRWLDEFIREHLESKAAKLALYKVEGYTTVLLVESSDIAMMSSASLFGAIFAAYGGVPASVDQVWYADTSLPEDVLFEDLTPGLLE